MITTQALRRTIGGWLSVLALVVVVASDIYAFTGASVTAIVQGHLGALVIILIAGVFYLLILAVVFIFITIGYPTSRWLVCGIALWSVVALLMNSTVHGLVAAAAGVLAGIAIWTPSARDFLGARRSKRLAQT